MRFVPPPQVFQRKCDPCVSDSCAFNSLKCWFTKDEWCPNKPLGPLPSQPFFFFFFLLWLFLSRVGGKKKSVLAFEPGVAFHREWNLDGEDKSIDLWNRLGSILDKSCASRPNQNHLVCLTAQSLSRQYEAFELDLCWKQARVHKKKDHHLFTGINMSTESTRNSGINTPCCLFSSFTWDFSDRLPWTLNYSFKNQTLAGTWGAFSYGVHTTSVWKGAKGWWHTINLATGYLLGHQISLGSPGFLLISHFV